MIDRTSYAAWHGLTPMREYLTAVSPGDFLVEGEGVRVRDASGRWYIDARSGLWNVNLGYSERRIIERMTHQLERLPFATATRFHHPCDITIEYANALAARLPEDVRRIRFANTGSQANETAVLLSRYARGLDGKPERTAVIALWDGYHGTGSGSSALTGEPYLHSSCGPVMPDVHHVPVADAMGSAPSTAPLERALDRLGPERVTAVIVEPVMGTGVIELPPAFLAELAARCRSLDVHLIFDEVTTGFGRTGGLTHAGLAGVTPDMITLGKGITSGYAPAAAVAVSEDIYDELFDHPATAPFASAGSTTDGHPVAMAAALAVLEVLDADGLLETIASRAELIAAQFAALRGRHDTVSQVRGVGMMWCCDLAARDGTPAHPSVGRRIRAICESHGVLLSDGGQVGGVMLMPPLVMSDDELLEVFSSIDVALTEVDGAVAETPRAIAR
jgi:adenosylmethionine-8-amino-7-oxononanoate aminotransferase